MKPLFYRDEMVRAVRDGNTARLDQLAAQLTQVEEIKRLWQALSHCPECAARAPKH